MGAHAPRFTMVEIFLMFGFAVISDILSLIPGLNVLIGILFWLVMGAYFFIKGVPLLKSKRIFGNTLVSFVIGLIPILSALPELTVATALNIYVINSRAKKQMREQEVEEASMMVNTRVERMQPEETQVEYKQRMNQANLQVQANSLISPSGAPVRTSKAIQFARTVPSTFSKAFSDAALGRQTGGRVIEPQAVPVNPRIANMLQNARMDIRPIPKARREEGKIENRLPSQKADKKQDPEPRSYVTDKPVDNTRPDVGFVLPKRRAEVSAPINSYPKKLNASTLPLADGAKV